MFQHPEDKLLKPGHVWHGVALGWKKNISTNIQSLPSTYERAAGIKMSTISKSLLFVSFYAPTAGNDDAFLESVSHLTEYLQTNMSHGDQILIGSDCNCSTKSTLRRQTAWRNFCELFDLQIHSAPLPTFHHHNGMSESCIDLFAATRGLDIGSISQYCTLETPLNLSSHDPIKTILSVQLEKSTDGSKYSATYSNFERKRIIWDPSRLPQYQQLAAKALSDAINFWDSPESIPLLSSLLSSLLVQCATMVFDSKTSSNHKDHKSPSKKIRQAQDALKYSFRVWKKAGKPASRLDQTRLAYSDARASLQRLTRYEDNLQQIKQNHHLMFSNKYNRNAVYASLRKSLGEDSSTSSVLHTPVGTFNGDDVLEGFTADAEYLGKPNDDSNNFDRGFYNICKLENCYIFDITVDDQVKIPPMNISQLELNTYSHIR